MKGNLKRVFQAMFMVLATVMLLSIPASAASSKTVATIGKKSYTSLEAAVKKVKKGQTIKLKKDVKVSGSLTLNRNVKYTINLNGHKITRKNSKQSSSLYIKKGTVTIKNGTIGCNIIVEGKGKATLSSIKTKYKPFLTVSKKGKLTVKSGTYDYIVNSGTLSIKKGTFKGYISNYGKMTISGGTFSGTDNQIYNYSGGTLKISGGTFNLNSSSDPHVMMNNKGAMTISGGKITLNSARPLNNDGSLTISGGSFTNSCTKEYADLIDNFGTFKMSGGTLKTNSSPGRILINRKGATAKFTGGTLKTNHVYKIWNRGSLSYSGVNLKDAEIDKS